MKLIHHKNKWYIAASKCTWWQRYAGAGSLFIIIIIAWLHFVYTPFNKAISWYSIEGNALHKKELALETKKQENAHIQNQLTDITQHINAIAKTSQNTDTPLEDMLRLIQEHHLMLNNYTVQQQKQKDWYSKNMVQFSLAGTQSALINFLTTLKKSKKMITISNISIDRVAKDQCTLQFEVGIVNSIKSIE